MSQRNVELVRSVYTGFAAGDVPAVLGAMSAEIEWNEAENFPLADGNPYRGPDRILHGIFARLGAEWEDFTPRPQEFLDAGDSVVVLGRYTGTFKANGAPIDAQFAHVWRIAGDRILRFDQYTDTLQVARATGAA